MIIPLRQSGNGYAADHTGTLHMDRKRTAVSGKVRDWLAMLFNGLSFDPEVETHTVRAAVIARHNVAFAADPIRVIRSRAFERRIKERLIEAAHINHDGEAALPGHGAQAQAQL